MFVDLEEVEAILDKRFNKRKNCIEYKVHWLNYPRSQATWEPIENLQHAKELVEEFDGQAFLSDKNEMPSSRDNELLASHGRKPDAASEPMVLKRGRGRPPKKPKSFGKPQSPISLDRQSSHQIMQEEVPPSQQVEPKRKRGRPRKVQEVFESEQLSPEKSLNEAKIGQGLSANVFEQRLSHQHEQDFFVLEINTTGGEFKFFVEDRLQKKWMTRSEVVQDHPLALVEFYERHLKVAEREEEGMRYPKRNRK